MSRYIEAKWLKDHIEVISYEGMWHETETDEFVSVENINSAPSIEIIRCRECKHGEYRSEFDDYECCYTGCGLVYDADHFCSDGERNSSEKPNNSKERSSE